ncbi:hypothetical protein EPH95_05070 [Salicibibacter halophilus]|uniref:NEAT domain-containing protein n=1 Tax=Salicibibacter halophilus TaxID=2502791 RepID=A0A514LFL0_9BACI|nr:hypothetical protein [Salicibibacter halophilus]QDI90629.1 hypothetical protein EPH95_05070 [Salicibibacter halophilus]
MGKGIVAIAMVLMVANSALQPVFAGPEVEIEPVPVMQADQQDTEKTFDVKHVVNEGNVYVESYIPAFSFYANQHQDKDIQGYLKLRINGKDEKDIHQAAFIIKGLEQGEHTIELEAYDENDRALGLKETFSITIPE